jgi:hypothetical protein
MLAQIGRFVVAFALCVSMGGQWVAMQSIAWTTMVISYSQHCSFRQAIVRTFDGGHPCDLCKGINKARGEEKKQDSQLSVSKTDLICTIRRVVLVPPFASLTFAQLITSPTDGFQEPPSPPPRVQFA